MSFFADILQKVRLFFNQNPTSSTSGSVENLRKELLEAAQQAASDGIITPQEMQMLLNLKDRLGLSEEDLEDVKYEVLTQQIEQVLEDGVVSDEELSFIESLFEGLALSGEAKMALEAQLKRVRALHRGETYENDDFYEEYEDDIYIENEQEDEIDDDYWGEDENEDTNLAAAAFALSEDASDNSLENDSEDESDEEPEDDSQEAEDDSDES
jgi:hypothetical protein